MNTKMIAPLLSGMALVLAGCGGQSSPAASSSASSSSTPAAFSHGLTILVGFAPGSAGDIAARMLQPYLTKTLGVPVVVQNMTGAGGNVAASHEFNLPKNSPTVLLSFVASLPLQEYLNHAKFKTSQFTPVYGLYGHSPTVVVASKTSAFKDFASLKSATRTVTVGVSGLGGPTWLAVADLALINHVKLQAIPFTGGSTSLDAALGGSVDLSSLTLPLALQGIQSGKAQPIVQFDSTRSNLLPNTPTILDVGGTQAETLATDEIGLFGPPGMPQSEVNALASAIGKAEQNATFIAKAKKEGLYPETVGPQAFQQKIASTVSAVKAQSTDLEKFLHPAK